MTEINTNIRANQQQAARQQRAAPEPTIASANRLTGLASGMDTQKTIETIIQVERRRLEPVEEQRADTLAELESFDLINQGLGNIKTSVDSLKNNATWEGKVVESSNEDVLTATATRGAKPGKNTMVVERLALNHQIASQNFESPDVLTGRGRLNITVGEGNPITIVVDESNNTLTGLKDAINFASEEVNATLIKTGNRTRPYQLVLTSQKTGSEGRIQLEVALTGGEAPSFQNSVETPSNWEGVGEPKAEGGPPPLTGVGASTAIVKIIGTYTGEESNKFTFTAVQTNVVGTDKALQMRWSDETGRSGVIKLDKINYAPGEPLEFVDGLALIFSEGEIIVNDSFSFTTNPEQPERFWWIDEEGRQANVSTPTAWSRQLTPEFGAPVIEGSYTGEDDEEFTLRVLGSGQVGAAENLNVQWESGEGQTGTVFVGAGYEPGSKLAIIDGITISLKPGVLTDGQVASFEVEAADQTSKWWKSDEDRKIPPVILNILNWALPDTDDDEVQGFMPELPGDVGPRVSTSQVSVSGEYTQDEPKVYTFTALDDGAIGTTKELLIRWEDDKGNFGKLNIGQEYEAGTPIPFDGGLAVAFNTGRVFNDDFFTLRTRTATIQPPQDALLRFGATELGGGLEITNSTNELEDVIPGVRLNLVSASEKPVTVTIRGDTELAKEAVLGFVNGFNDLAALITELTKFEPESKFAAPLLGNSDVTNIRNSLAEMLIDPVAGLPKSTNMLFSIGISLNDQGLLEVDDTILNNKIADDFGIVADLFRNKGESDNSSIAFLGMDEKTAINTEGYPVDIDAPATQGFYLSPTLPGSILIDATNNKFSISVDGRESEQIELPPGQYTPSNYARALQNEITKDKIIGQSGVRVVAEGDALRVLSGRFGSRSSISFAAGEAGNAGVGLTGGVSENGRDVVGSINGNPAEGNGQLLKAPDGSGPASGLRVFAKLSDTQINPTGAEANVTVTKGVASRLATYLDSMVNPLTGQMRRITENLRNRMSNLDGQLDRMEERIAKKRESLQGKFARLESKLSTLRAQQSYLKGQLGGGGGALPGLRT